MPELVKRIAMVSALLTAGLLLAGLLGVSAGSSRSSLTDALNCILGGCEDGLLENIIWRIRFPRVVLAALTGATLSLGGLVFQALLRNPLAEPYILGVSGGSAVGAILGIMIGLSRFPGVCIFAFAGSMATLGLVVVMGSGRSGLSKDSLLLSGVMINAFCSSVITFLISMSQDARIHNILFWLMGDMSLPDMKQAGLLALMVFPCFILIFRLSHVMNLLVMGRESARSMGVNAGAAVMGLLVATSFMVSATVSYCGLLGFVGLVAPHLLRLIFGPDHRVLAPACILGGGAYMILCDILARILPRQGEMPTGVVTALIGAPLFIWLLKRSRT